MAHCGGPVSASYVCSLGTSGLEMLAVSLSHLDPHETSGPGKDGQSLSRARDPSHTQCKRNLLLYASKA